MWAVNQLFFTISYFVNPASLRLILLQLVFLRCSFITGYSGFVTYSGQLSGLSETLDTILTQASLRTNEMFFTAVGLKLTSPNETLKVKWQVTDIFTAPVKRYLNGAKDKLTL